MEVSQPHQTIVVASSHSLGTQNNLWSSNAFKSPLILKKSHFIEIKI